MNGAASGAMTGAASGMASGTAGGMTSGATSVAASGTTSARGRGDGDAARLEFRRIAVIGFGEAGTILGADLVKAGCDVATYDILFDTTESREVMRAKAERVRVRTADSLREAVSDAQLVISAVTASSSGEVAAGAAQYMRPGQIFLDINSCSPAKKQSSAKALEASGADYVEAAVMAPVPPQRLKVPMLLGGPRAAAVAPALARLGMNAQAIAAEIGIASAVKMCRSVVIKGIESLAVESMLAARQFGAEEQVLASLNQTYPGIGWDKDLPDYLISRVAEHGRRRAAEMREVARTLEDIGIVPTMATAIAERQDQLIDAMNANGIAYEHDTRFSWRALADALAPPIADAMTASPAEASRSRSTTANSASGNSGNATPAPVRAASPTHTKPSR
jgi:3-hydroxyisobutyrate dehydrogenase-like beta-hydroxyacid dehydrogenase